MIDLINLMHTGPFEVNTYIVSLDGKRVFIVDPACCDYTNDKNIVLDYIKGNGLDPVAIILTHGHFDHVAGIKVLKDEYPSMSIYIHSLDSKYIGQQSADIHSKVLNSIGFKDFIPYVSNLPESDNLIKDGDILFSEWKVIHTPGHTKGSCCFYNENNKALISGDTLFYGSYGRTDLLDGSSSDMASSLNKLFSAIPGDTKVYPGHDKAGFTLSEGGEIW